MLLPSRCSRSARRSTILNIAIAMSAGSATLFCSASSTAQSPRPSTSERPGQQRSVGPYASAAIGSPSDNSEDMFAGNGQPMSPSERLHSGSSIMPSKPSVQELRMARAQHLEQQRIARMERNLWMGYEPLRPSLNAVPMMSSRYAPPRIIIPIYVP